LKFRVCRRFKEKKFSDLKKKIFFYQKKINFRNGKIVFYFLIFLVLIKKNVELKIEKKNLY